MATSICTGLKSTIVGLRLTTEKKFKSPKRFRLIARVSSPKAKTDCVEGACNVARLRAAYKPSKSVLES